MTIERFVAFFLGPIIAAAAAWLTGAAAKYGLHLNPAEVTALATAGALTAAGSVVTWLKGRQNPEILKLEAEAKSELAKLPPGLRGELEAWIKAEVAKGQADVVHAIDGAKGAAKDPGTPVPTQGPGAPPAQVAQP
jgi:hypothetical protein